MGCLIYTRNFSKIYFCLNLYSHLICNTGGCIGRVVTTQEGGVLKEESLHNCVIMIIMYEKLFSCKKNV